MDLFFNINSRELEPIADVLIELFNRDPYKYKLKYNDRIKYKDNGEGDSSDRED